MIKARNRLSHLIKNTPTEHNRELSNYFNANIFLKREDRQLTRSFKIRGALNKMLKYQGDYKSVNCASAGNHAQGIAYAASLLNVPANIFVPVNTPLQKIDRIKSFGGKLINLIKIGDNFNESLQLAKETANDDTMFIHPFDDQDVIDGQSTLGLEIFDDVNPDIILTCVGGGGLMSGLINSAQYFKPECKIIGVEPVGADSMRQALSFGNPIYIQKVDTFVDGASVSIVGDLNYEIISKHTDKNDIITITNNELCCHMLDLYQNEGIIVEPAGALAYSGLFHLPHKDIKDKTIVIVLSGGNNDATRYPEIIEKKMLYLNKKHYFIIKFSQQPRQLRNFILSVLGDHDDITRFEYIKKTNTTYGNVLLGIETSNIGYIIDNLNKYNYKYQKITEQDLIYSYIV